MIGTKKLRTIVDKDYKKKEPLNSRILLTPFEVKDSYNGIPYIDYTKYNSEYLVINFYELTKYTTKLSPIAIKVLFDLIYILEPDTNCITAYSYNKISILLSKQGIQTNYFIKIIRMLIDANILIRIKGKLGFIINHNIFYKGDLNKFAARYKTLYGEWKMPEMYKDRVIINKGSRFIKDAKDVENFKDTVSNMNFSKFNFIK